MASIGHIAIGMAAARVARERLRTSAGADEIAATKPLWPSMLAWSALSLLPDADVIGFAMGVRYADPWGHRGATHSLTFAIALATVLALIAPRFGQHRRRMWLI